MEKLVYLSVPQMNIFQIKLQKYNFLGSYTTIIGKIKKTLACTQYYP